MIRSNILKFKLQNIKNSYQMENYFKDTVSKVDSELEGIIKKEYHRQLTSLELIASENYTGQAVLNTLGSILTNKYSEGLPGHRYYGGNEYIDQIENLTKSRALEVYHLDSNQWDVNVQPYSGTPANFAVYTGLLKPGDKIMGLDLPSGGHLSHGYQTATKKLTGSSIYFTTESYSINSDGWLDYQEISKAVTNFKPNLLICGASCYSRDFDYQKFREMADSVGAYLMVDMAHISGLVAVGALNNPFEYADVVTTTTHKTLSGPRSGMIFTKKDDCKLVNKIDMAVFPGLQGGPHQHQIGAIACQLGYVLKPEFKIYIQQVITNAQTLAKSLMDKGYTVMTGGTDNHLLLVSFRELGLTGSKIEKVAELCNISLNKNTVVGDKSAFSPSGIRLGTPAMTTRGFKEKDFQRVGDVLDSVIKISQEVQGKYGKKLKDFEKGLEEDENIISRIKTLKKEISDWVETFPFYSETQI